MQARTWPHRRLCATQQVCIRTCFSTPAPMRENGRGECPIRRVPVELCLALLFSAIEQEEQVLDGACLLKDELVDKCQSFVQLAKCLGSSVSGWPSRCCSVAIGCNADSSAHIVDVPLTIAPSNSTVRVVWGPAVVPASASTGALL